jgi:hypothetical protein
MHRKKFLSETQNRIFNPLQLPFLCATILYTESRSTLHLSTGFSQFYAAHTEWYEIPIDF